MNEKQIVILMLLSASFAAFIVIANLLDNKSINGSKANTVGDGQHGTARWATGAEYGKITYVGDDYVEFNIIDIDTMEFRETTIINASLILEVVFGGADISRIVAEVSSMLPEG